MKPMLAASIEDIAKLRFPLLASPKIDGIRCLLITSPRTGNRLAASRTLKPIANRFIRATLEGSSLPAELDGELIVGSTFQDTSSGVMTIAGQPQFKYCVFDWLGGKTIRAIERYTRYIEICSKHRVEWLKPIEKRIINNLEALDAYECDMLSEGYEGVMLQTPNGVYKYGRSTFGEHNLLKLKRFFDSEATVIGYTELQHNGNELTTDNLGYAERSSEQEGLVPGNMLGALIVRDCKTKTEFKIGTGFTARQRNDIWAHREQYLNRLLTYKYQPIGVKDKPRAPVFLRWRTDLC